MIPFTPERFREVESLRDQDGRIMGLIEGKRLLRLQNLWTLSEARALRDWLTKALPEEKIITDTKPKPSDTRNGCFLDSHWCCKVCDGEIPDGHTENCDIWRIEKEFREHIAGPYNETLLDRDRLRAEVERLTTERDALRAALQSLLDEQNGPPLFRRYAEWTVACERAREVLEKAALMPASPCLAPPQ